MKNLILLLSVFTASFSFADCDSLKMNGSTIEISDGRVKIISGKETVKLPQTTMNIDECLRLEPVADTKNIASIEYWSQEAGTTTLISYRYLGLIDVAQKKWALEPVQLDRKVSADEGTQLTGIAITEWKKAKDGSPILFRKAGTEAEVQIWPSLTKAPKQKKNK